MFKTNDRRLIKFWLILSVKLEPSLLLYVSDVIGGELYRNWPMLSHTHTHTHTHTRVVDGMEHGNVTHNDNCPMHCDEKQTLDYLWPSVGRAYVRHQTVMNCSKPHIIPYPSLTVKSQQFRRKPSHHTAYVIINEMFLFNIQLHFLVCHLHGVSKNVPTFELSVTLSNLNR